MGDLLAHRRRISSAFRYRAAQLTTQSFLSNALAGQASFFGARHQGKPRLLRLSNLATFEPLENKSKTKTDPHERHTAARVLD